MTDSLPGRTAAALHGHRTHHTRHHHRHAAAPASRASFATTLAGVVGQAAGGAQTGSTGRAGVAPALPPAVEAALQTAMRHEGAPAGWRDALAFIISRESGGVVDRQSQHHSARGLFQLTAANYQFNPNGAASFGNAVEEAQGGIRYIGSRYGDAAEAAAFWQRHRWY